MEPANQKKSALKKCLVSCDVFVIFTAVTPREIPSGYLNVMQYKINESEFSKLHHEIIALYDQRKWTRN